ncbi:MAG: T9SS type A sorting domain-containing protein, partial [Bacteroidota bacterium]|nr:T9SS type A sorting domain-containing protein [Bacteroidota bacterium]
LSGNITVREYGGSSDTYALIDIRYVNFTNSTIGVQLAENQNETGKLQVFPNPANDVLNIRHTISESQLTSLEILSVEGKTVYKQVLTGNTSLHQVNISALPKGLYLCRAIGEKTIDTIKFIKN